MYKLALSLLTVVHIHSQANITTENKQITESIQIYWYEAEYFAKFMTSLTEPPNTPPAVPIFFNADIETNSIVITGSDYDSVIKAKQVILELDIPLPIVHMEVLTGEAQEQARLETIAYLESLLELYKQPTSN